MKGRAKLLAAAAALAVLAGAWGLAETMAGEQAAAAEAAVMEQEPELIYLSAGTAEDIFGLSWSRAGETVSLLRDDSGAWVREDDAACPLDQIAAEALVSAAGNITARSVIGKVVDFEPYGLAEPALTLTVVTAEKTVTYAVGGQTLAGESYLSVEGENAVYTETGALLPAFSVTMDELILLETAPEDIGEIWSLSVTTEVGAYELKHTEDASGRWNSGAYSWFVTQGEESFPLEAEQALALCGNVTGIEFAELVDWHGENPERYGLDSPQGTASVTYVARDGVEKTFALEFGDYTGGYVYVRMAGSERVYTADGGVLDRLMYPDWETMRPLDVFPVDMETVTGAEIGLGGHTYKVEIITGESEMAGAVVCYVSNGWTLDTAGAEEWFRRLTALKAESTADQTQGREELLSVTVSRKDEAQPEVSMTVWGYDSGRCLCVVNGEDPYFIPREEAEALVREAESLFIIE